MCGPCLLIVHDTWRQWWSVCLSHFDYIWPVRACSIKGWTGLNRYCFLGNICRTFRNVMWPVVQFYFSNMSSPVQFQLESGYQVLPPHRRWDLCGAQLQQFGRKDWSFRIIGKVWRCRAQEFLLGLWHHFEKAVGSGRWTLGSENLKELKRFPETSMICLQCLRHSVIANWFKCSCLKLFLPVVWIGKRVCCLSSSLFWCKILNRLPMCEPWLLIFHNMSPLAAVLLSCFYHFDSIWPVPTYLIKGWTGLNRYCYPWQYLQNFQNAMAEQDWTGIVILGNICRTFRM